MTDQERLERRGFTETEDGVLVREWEKEVEMCFIGPRTERYKVFVDFRPNGYTNVKYIRDCKLEKEKTYTGSIAQVMRYMEQTIEYAGYTL